MTIAVYLCIYAGALLFLAGCLWRIRNYARLPFHLRWELYPVPHEEPKHAEHGGSYFETGEWWLRPQAVHHRSEWLAMLREIVFLKGVWEFNRPLWLPSFLFHFGLYLSIVTVGIAVVAAAPGIAAAGGLAGTLLAVLISVCRWTGLTGTVFVLLGVSFLLERRISDPTLKNYTKAGDIFNLVFFLAAFGFLGVGFLGRTASIEAVVRGALQFDRSVQIAPIAGIGIALASALAAYIPFTHMSHFIAKYFTWHSVRWDDQRNARNGPVEQRVAASLRYRPTWAAAHIGADGKRSWAQIATTNPAEEERK